MKQLAGAAEKIVSTYIEAVVTLLFLSGIYTYAGVNAALVASVPAALTAFVALLPSPTGLPFYLDLIYRTGRTYVATFLGFLIAMPVFHYDQASWKSFAVAALPAALTVVKGALASKVGVTDKTATDGTGATAAVLPFKADPATDALVAGFMNKKAA